MGFHGYYFNIKSGYITNKYPHCYVGIKRIGAKWGLYNRVSNHDYKWGLYNRVSNKSCCWGNYGGDDMIITTSDYSLTQSGKFIVENNWHKISGTPFSKQTKLYDANGRAMNGNDYVIDIYFKIIACKDDIRLFWKSISTNFYYYGSTLGELINEVDCATTMVSYYGSPLCAIVNDTQDNLFRLPNFENIDDLPQGTPLSDLTQDSLNASNFYWAPSFFRAGAQFCDNVFLNTHNGPESTSSGYELDNETYMRAMLKGIGHSNDNITYIISTSVQDIGVPFTDNDNSHKYLLPELRRGFIMIDNCISKTYGDVPNITEIAALYMCLDCHRV